LLADLAVTMTDGKTSVVPGASNTYTITVTNNGPSTVTSLTLTDTIPAALLNSNFAPSVGAYDTNTGVWSGLNLASGDTVSMTLTGTIDPAATGSLSNTVTVAPPSGWSDANSANDSATDTDTLTPQADLAVAMTDGKTSAVPGTSTTYTITVTNNGPSTVSSLTLTDSIPAALLNATFGTPSVGSYDSGSGLWSGLSLASGQSVSITLTGTIDPNAPGSLSNTITVSAPAGTTDPNPGNNSFTDTDTLTPQADLAVTVTDGATTAVAGTSNIYFITVTNNGPSTAVGAAVTDLFPAALTNVIWTATASPGSIASAPSGTGNIVTVVTLLSGGTVTFTAVGQINPSAIGSLTNTVTVSSPAGSFDSNPANNAATDTDTLALPADLAVIITDAATTLVPGSVDTYTITVTNNGGEHGQQFHPDRHDPGRAVERDLRQPLGGEL
jgi:uncharacterized repeat protein (TIGR01451 family)